MKFCDLGASSCTKFICKQICNPNICCRSKPKMLLYHGSYSTQLLSFGKGHSKIAFQINLLYYKDKINQMGIVNTCCQDKNIDNSLFDSLKNSSRSKNTQFYQSDWPIDDEYIKSKLDQIKNKEQYSHIFQKCTIMKHKSLDKYYLGVWNQEGNQEGFGILYEPQSYFYYGEFNLVPNGKGKLELIKQGIVYEGEMREGMAQGQGALKSLDNRVSFKGIMENSLPKTGKLSIINQHQPNKSFDIELNDFPKEPTKIKYGDGRIYEGFINKRSYAPEGKGTAYFIDNSHYQGDWEDGEMHGKGVFYWNDGNSYHGQYQHGRKHGFGKFYFSSNKYYDGQWVNGKQQGKGSLYDKHGKMLKRGIWKDGVFDKQDEDN